jgi:signal peptidase I
MLKEYASELVQGLLLRKDRTPHSEAKHGFLRRNVEGFAGAIAFALLIKQFAIDTFQVPTESMEPVIIGRGGMGDRILVDRFDYLARDPERFEIVVFKYPLSRLVNYVKRAVGLPGERIVIWRGQIFAAPNDGEDVKCTKKPHAVQEALFDLNRVLPEDESEGFNSGKFFKNWQISGSFLPQWSDGAVRIDAPADSERWFENKFPVKNDRRDRYAADAEGKGGGQDVVGDVRFEIEARPEAGAKFVLVEINDPANSGRGLLLSLAVEGGAPASSLAFAAQDLTTPELAAVKLKPGKTSKVVFDNVDQTVAVRVDGDEVCRRDYETKPQKNVGGGVPTRLRVGVRGGSASFERLGVARDTHYTEYPGAPTEFHVPPGKYLMFGDNSPNSLDARAWRKSAIKIHGEDRVLYGDFEAVSDRIENQRRMRNPFKDEKDGKTYFIDVEGNLILLQPGQWDLCDAATGEVRVPSVMDVDDLRDPSAYLAFDHYVPREFVVGRAKFVFFPLTRVGILR